MSRFLRLSKKIFVQPIPGGPGTPEFRKYWPRWVFTFVTILGYSMACAHLEYRVSKGRRCF